MAPTLTYKPRRNTVEKVQQLKKNSFLAVITAEPMTRQDIFDALENYEFISSYLDYLIDHFANQGKIVVAEDGTINLKPGKAAANRNVFCVEYDQDLCEYVMRERTLGRGQLLTPPDKEAGWAKTYNAAVKCACRTNFAQYKADNAEILNLKEATEEAEVVEQEAA